jgi:hypothetical protein
LIRQIGTKTRSLTTWTFGVTQALIVSKIYGYVSGTIMSKICDNYT